MQAVREAVRDCIELPEATRPLPNIIHTTIARYKAEQAFAPVEKAVKGLSVSFEQTFDSFKLVKENKMYTADYDTLYSIPIGPEAHTPQIAA